MCSGKNVDWKPHFLATSVSILARFDAIVRACFTMDPFGSSPQGTQFCRSNTRSTPSLLPVGATVYGTTLRRANETRSGNFIPPTKNKNHSPSQVLLILVKAKQSLAAKAAWSSPQNVPVLTVFCFLQRAVLLLQLPTSKIAS